ncbi:TPA: hypothetical protein DIC20_04395 [Candidatus Dependentiae bacterium]|nr:MAG: replication and repair protein RecF protein [candidate division TM6 bacterium GW2011_GWF2_36_131]KKQ03200.1 MAG: replication and repair protein RecF protein [candidate division TM6 bacterium GW2011_GWE2_36_25]KKQ18559.1 MAG: replication and repair protein RecF protein [candidate division TM6 bacterium GW2011_GWA2_36_9]HBR70370.1 hypothetical protein [Candidatus Dependentiae bacterium]HCU00915.1 hypothetical protein [Candidatus Dependentiae bacterium]
MAHIQSLDIKNFRCFDHLSLTFETPIVLIKGENGTGKTALLEALYFLCYLRSFKTYAPRELIRFNQDGFFIRTHFIFENTETDLIELQVGVTQQKKLIKLNNKPAKTFNDLLSCLRVVSLTENDLQIIQGSPEARRSFIDNYIFLQEPTFSQEMRTYRATLNQRNALLQRKMLDNDLYKILTKKLWTLSDRIQRLRTDYLKNLETEIQLIQSESFSEHSIDLAYFCKRPLKENFESFYHFYTTLQIEEIKYQRSLFGIHLDDLSIQFRKKSARVYASRGQQKLIALFLKIAQIKGLIKKEGLSILLLDDFMTDFDEERIKQVLPLLLSLKCLLFFTCAQKKSFLEEELNKYGAQIVILERK